VRSELYLVKRRLHCRHVSNISLNWRRSVAHLGIDRVLRRRRATDRRKHTPHQRNRDIDPNSKIDVRIAKNKSDRMPKPLSAMHHVAEGAWFPAKIAALGT
jgi:hypothetical protein